MQSCVVISVSSKSGMWAFSNMSMFFRSDDQAKYMSSVVWLSAQTTRETQERLYPHWAYSSLHIPHYASDFRFVPEVLWRKLNMTSKSLWGNRNKIIQQRKLIQRNPWWCTILMRYHPSFEITVFQTVPFVFPCKWAPDQCLLFSLDQLCFLKKNF